MTRPLLLLVALFAPLLVLLAGCSGGSNAKATSTTSGPGVTDQEYLKAICTGIQQFSDALISAKNADAISTVVKNFSASMKQINPPPDLRQFNTDFTKYLDDAVNDPTSLVTTKPPLPPNSVRQRLASEETSVPECKSSTFFDASAPTPTPSK